MTLVARINETFLQIAADLKSKVFRKERAVATTAGQTSFAVPNGYSVGGIIVIYNGAVLDDTDFTASDGVNVVLAQGATTVGEVMNFIVLSAIRAQDDALLQSTVANLPPAASSLAKVRYCTNMAGRPGPVYSDGTIWRRMGDDSQVTT